jgi:tetratricopeptide (TPR) repeat protein
VAREAWGDVVLLAAGDRLAGAVHVAVQGCRPPAGPHGGIVLERSRSGAAPAPRPVAAARERASPVLREAAAALSAGDLEAARRRFLAAVAIDPSSAEACNGVGVTSRLRNDLGDALAWYERALAADPDLGAPYYNLACVHALRGETALALRWLRMAVLLGHVGAAAMEQDPDLEAVRAEPAFRALVGGRS